MRDSLELSHPDINGDFAHDEVDFVTPYRQTNRADLSERQERAAELMSESENFDLKGRSAAQKISQSRECVAQSRRWEEAMEEGSNPNFPAGPGFPGTTGP